MNARKRLALSALVVASVLLVSSTGGFSAMSADRGVEVSVANDPHAFLALKDRANVLTFDNGRHDDVQLMEIENNLGQELDLRITIQDETAVPNHLYTTAPKELDRHEKQPVTVDIQCGNGENQEQWTVDIVASGEGVRIELSRMVTVICTGDPQPTEADGEADATGEYGATPTPGADEQTPQPDTNT